MAITKVQQYSALSVVVQSKYEEIIFNFYMGLLHVIHKNFAASLLIYKVTADRENFAVKEFRG